MIPFIKMHGCGNDYVFLDCFHHPLPNDLSQLARKISDRHRGVGGDGLVVMLPPDSETHAARMRMFNADGSEGVLCGNALRCMAMWLFRMGHAGKQFGIAMGDRIIGAEIVEAEEQRQAAVVRIRVGPPVMQDAPGQEQPRFLRDVALEGIELPDLLRPPTYVSMGNPHLVLFVRSLTTCQFESLGPQIETHPAFPNRTNVEFAEIVLDQNDRPLMVKVRVWERGSGETLACGSGACAVAVAGMASGLLPDSVPVMISMRGGDLTVRWNDRTDVFLEGPATEVFRGVIH